MWWLFALAVLALLIVVFVLAKRELVTEADSERDEVLREKENWNRHKYMSAGDVTRETERLLKAVDARFADDASLRESLTEVIEEWSEVRIQAFQDRRSWVRRLDENGKDSNPPPESGEHFS
ncbi:hypothetical protein SCOR_02220 [Sulfidibacter corallicola]|uniref:Uncharacterized protein n=1 Tax=Sulfidibacter corallicola TaxID=2818388 RepID=A0A8A4TII8_SULCO|nr:hypothetical protein [Sulfidibacter corallicola]QTD48661.1 hypothetical protein J3U87_24025 [Sulfidibacter corallicola]